MRILYFGNQGNTGFRISNWLRKRGHEVVLFLETTAKNRSLPEWENPDYIKSYPDWVYFFHPPKIEFPFDSKKKVFFNLLRVFFTSLNDVYGFNINCEKVKEFKNFDLVITTGSNWFYALQIGPPVIFIPVGSDLTSLPFLNNNFTDAIKSYFARVEIKNIVKILGYQVDYEWSTKALGVYDKLYPFFLPVDYNSIRANVDYEFFNKIYNKYSNFDILILNFTRKNLDKRKNDYKGSEKAIKPIFEFIKENPRKKIKIIVGKHGNDFEYFYELLNNYGILPYCDFYEHLSLPKLHAFFSLPNTLLLEAFWDTPKLNLGGLNREAFCFGLPQISCRDVDSSIFKSIYGDNCPLLFASNSDSIYKKIKYVYSLNTNEYNSLVQKNREWAFEYLHWENRIGELEEVLQKVLDEKKEKQKQKR